MFYPSQKRPYQYPSRQQNEASVVSDKISSHTPYPPYPPAKAGTITAVGTVCATGEKKEPPQIPRKGPYLKEKLRIRDSSTMKERLSPLKEAVTKKDKFLPQIRVLLLNYISNLHSFYLKFSTLLKRGIKLVKVLTISLSTLTRTLVLSVPSSARKVSLKVNKTRT